MLFVLDTTKWKIVATCDTFEQAEYLGDILCPVSNAHIDDVGFAGLDVFNNDEIARMYENHVNDHIHNKRDRNDRDFLVGLILNIANDLKDERTVQLLHATLGHAPVKPAPIPAKEPKTAATPRTSGTGERRGGAKELIFALADAAWETAGKPTDIATVLKLRKQWMNDWEVQEGVKKTTASSTLGAWQKERLTP